MKLKKEVIRGFIVIVIIIVVIIIIKAIQGIDTTHKDLVNLGYTEEEATSIMELLDETEITRILNDNYYDLIPKFITAKYYIPNNYNEYLEVAGNVNTQDIDTIIALVNTRANENNYENPEEVEVSNTMLVNKYNYLPKNYNPDDLVDISNMYAYEGHQVKEEVYNNYVRMWKDANDLDLTLLVNSSFRTYEIQKEQHDLYGDNYAARPGYSEHETGLALDIVTYGNIGNEFATTDEFAWLKDNAHKYGFILRYPEGKEELTGYSYESWHYRYLGVELATKVYESKLTYDEYHAYYCEYKNEC